MFIALFLWAGWCGVAIVAARVVQWSAPARNPLVLVACTIFVALVGWQAWGVLVVLGIVPMGSIARSLGVHDDDLWFLAITLVPPLVSALAFGIALLRQWSRASK